MSASYLRLTSLDTSTFSFEPSCLHQMHCLIESAPHPASYKHHRNDRLSAIFKTRQTDSILEVIHHIIFSHIHDLIIRNRAAFWHPCQCCLIIHTLLHFQSKSTFFFFVFIIILRCIAFADSRRGNQEETDSTRETGTGKTL